MEHLVLTWAQEVATTSLRVNLFDPGVVATRLRAEAMPGEDPATLPPPRLFETMIFADALETAEQMRASFGGMMAGFRGGGGDGVGAFVDDNQFGGYRERCATWDQAVAQHATAVACVRRSMSG